MDSNQSVNFLASNDERRSFGLSAQPRTGRRRNPASERLSCEDAGSGKCERVVVSESLDGVYVSWAEVDSNDDISDIDSVVISECSVSNYESTGDELEPEDTIVDTCVVFSNEYSLDTLNRMSSTVPDNEEEDTSPEWLKVFISSVWEWEKCDIADIVSSHCSFKKATTDSSLEEREEEGWVLMIRTLSSNYAGVFLFDDALNLQVSIPLDPKTVVNCDEDLIGSGQRNITICYDLTGSGSYSIKQQLSLNPLKYKSLQQDFLQVLSKTQSIYTGNSLATETMSTEWQSRNLKWVAQFSERANKEAPKVRSNPANENPESVLRPVFDAWQKDRRATIAAPHGSSLLAIPSSPKHLTRNSSENLSKSATMGRVGPETVQRKPRIYTKTEDKRFVAFTDFKLFVTTFNVNMKTSSWDDSSMPQQQVGGGGGSLRSAVEDWLQYKQMKRDPPDLVCICLQECGGLNRFSNFISSLDYKIQNGWKNAICQVLEPLKLAAVYENNVGCTYMIILVKRALVNDVSLKHKADFPLGQGGMANKGAVVIQMSVHEQKFLFLGVHLAPHDTAQAVRMRQIAKICDEYRHLLITSDYVFWMGDFNFRAAVNDPILSYTDFLLLSNGQPELFSDYRSKDEWKRARLENMVDMNEFFNVSESQISFAPSYKFEPGKSSFTDVSTGAEVLPYDLSHRPSWCDRIFYYSAHSDSPLKVLQYGCELKCTLSDHKPVFANVVAQIEYLDRKKKYLEYRATEIRNNSSRPNADLDKALHNIPNDDECFKLLRCYQIDTHLKLKEDVDEARFLFRCCCGDKCEFYRKQFGASDFEFCQALVDHVEGNVSPVSFVAVNELQGRITAGYPASIGFDLQITERNIHELYQLKGRKFAKLVPKSKHNKFEQAQIDLIFCLYKDSPFTNEWLKGADKYIAVNLNVKPYMHGICPTALCYIEKPIFKMSVAEIAKIVQIAQLYEESRHERYFGDRDSHLLGGPSPSPSPSPCPCPQLNCPKEIVLCLNSINGFIKNYPNERNKMNFVTSLFQPKESAQSHDTCSIASSSASADSVDYSMTVVEPDDSSQEYLDMAIAWLTGVSDYVETPFQTQAENEKFITGLAKALLLYFKSIQFSLFGTRNLPSVSDSSTHVTVLDSLSVPQSNKVVIGYFFSFLAETVIPIYSEHLNSSRVSPTKAVATFRHNLDTLKSTLVGACFVESSDQSEDHRRHQVVEVLLRRPSLKTPATQSSRISTIPIKDRPTPLIDLSF